MPLESPISYSLVTGPITQISPDSTCCSFCIFLQDASASDPDYFDPDNIPDSEIVVFNIKNSLRISPKIGSNEKEWTTWTKKLEIEFYNAALLADFPGGSIVEGSQLPWDVPSNVPRTSLLTGQTSILPPSLDAGYVKYIQNAALPKLYYGSAREIHPSCDIALVTTWLSMCENCHGTRCARAESTTMAELRLLDVKSMRLIQFAKGSTVRYIALSYVWGKQEFKSLKKNDLTEVLKRGFPVDSQFHPAIRDAIKVVYEMKEQYLWVDCLCIIQDCEEDKLSQIEQMAAIYGNALLTIIAAGNDSSNLGLPGVEQRSSTWESVFTHGNLRLMESKSSTGTGKRTVYGRQEHGHFKNTCSRPAV